MKKAIGLILFVIILTSTLTSCLQDVFENSLEDFFAQWTAEEFKSDVAFYDGTYTTIFFSNGTTYDLEYNAPWNYLVVKDGLLYMLDKVYLKGEEYDELVKIDTYDLETAEIKTVYSVKACPMDADGEYIGYGYSKIYYCNSEIVIRDGASTVVFNINTHTAEYLPPEEKETPVSDYEITRIKDDKGYNDLNKVVIKKGDEQRIIDINYMASRNDYAKRLTEIEYPKGLFHIDDPLVDFINEVTVIGDRIYLLCSVYDEDGSENNVVFSYNYESDEFKFVFHSFSISGMWVYAIPVEQTNS